MQDCLTPTCRVLGWRHLTYRVLIWMVLTFLGRGFAMSHFRVDSVRLQWGLLTSSYIGPVRSRASPQSWEMSYFMLKVDGH